MKYKTIKKIINKIHNSIEGIHREIIQNDLYESLAQIGSGSDVCQPFIITNPDCTSIGDNTTILANCRMQAYRDSEGKRGRITIGDGCFIGYYFTILAGGDVNIGNDVLIAANVGIFSENHGMDPLSEESYMHQPLICRDVNIGDGCWISESVKIMPGVDIGEKCIIGAGAVVTKSVPAFSIAAGNPARVVKRFDFDRCEWIYVQ